MLVQNRCLWAVSCPLSPVPSQGTGRARMPHAVPFTPNHETRMALCYPDQIQSMEGIACSLFTKDISTARPQDIDQHLGGGVVTKQDLIHCAKEIPRACLRKCHPCRHAELGKDAQVLAPRRVLGLDSKVQMHLGLRQIITSDKTQIINKHWEYPSMFPPSSSLVTPAQPTC